MIINKNKNIEMNKYIEIFKSIKTILGMETETELKFGEVVNKEGTVFYYDGEKLEVGTPLFNDKEMTTPITDGEIETETEKIMVKDGLVSEINQIEVEVVEEELVVETPVEEEIPVPTVEDLQKIIDELKKENDELKIKIGEMEKVEKMASEKEQKLKLELEKLGNLPSTGTVTMSNQTKRELTEEEKFVNSIKAIKALKNN